MTTQCPFFIPKFFKSKSSDGTVIEAPYPYCIHPKHSPVKMDVAWSSPETLLHCEGNRSKCPIADKYNDLG